MQALPGAIISSCYDRELQRVSRVRVRAFPACSLPTSPLRLYLRTNDTISVVSSAQEVALSMQLLRDSHPVDQDRERRDRLGCPTMLTSFQENRGTTDFAF